MKDGTKFTKSAPPRDPRRRPIAPSAGFGTISSCQTTSCGGRSAALLIGTLSPDDDTFTLTVTASTPRPIRLSFPSLPTFDALRSPLEAEIQHYYDDVHGAPAWRRHMTLQFAEEIRQELAGEGFG